MTSSKFGDSVALEMNRILNDPSFKGVFEPEDYSQAVNADASYQAFVRVASKKDKDEDEKEDKKAKKEKDKKDKKEDKKKDKKDKKEKVDKKDKKEAIEYIVNNLITTSEALDNLGLTKSATVTLGLLNGILKEATEEEFEDDPELSERIHELGIESAMGPFGDDDVDVEVEEPTVSEDETPIEAEDVDTYSPELFLADDKKKKDEKDEDEEDEDEEEEDEDEEDEEDDENDLNLNPFRHKKPQVAAPAKKPEMSGSVSGAGVPSTGTAEDWDPLNPELPPVGASKKITNKRAIALMAEIDEWLKK